MELHELSYPAGSRRPRKRRGRGTGSGRGKTAGRGEKGQKSRSGYKLRPGFEGGQMPLIRRLPKVGFTPPRPRRWTEVNISELNRFPDGSEVTPEALRGERIIRGWKDGVKILGRGDLEKRLVVRAHRFSKKARQAIEAAGGSCHPIADTEMKPSNFES
jgi:large subunit ribosomal protein L15